MKLLPRDTDRLIADLASAVKQLQREVHREDRPLVEERSKFSVMGDMEVRTSGKDPVRTGGQLVSVITTVTGAGTGDTEFDILLDGASVGSVTVPAAEASGQSDYLGNIRVPAGSSLQLDITQAGMHPDMVVTVVMKG